MTTIINTPPAGDNSGSGSGLIIGAIVAIVIITIFFVYGLPAIRSALAPQGGSIDINLKLPQGGNEAPAPATSP